MKINRFGFKDKLSTSRIQMEVFACTILVLLVEILYNIFRNTNVTSVDNLDYVLRDVYIFLISTSTCLLWDFMFYLPRLFTKNKISLKKFLYKSFTSYSIVSGGIIALLLPIGIQLYFVPIITFVSIFVFKNIFGGFGKNIFNPAIVGIIFALLVFKPNYVLGDVLADNYLSSSSVELFSTPLFSKLNYPSNYIALSQELGIKIWDIFNGFYIGEIGTRNSFVLFIVLIYLIARKIADFRLGIIYILSYFVSTFILFSLSTNFVDSFFNSLVYIFVSPVVFISAFVINDPVTTPVTRANKIVVSLLLGLLTFVSRLIFNNLVSIYICVLIVNLVSLILNKTTITLKNNILQKIISGLIVISLIITPIIYLGSNNLILFQVK